MPRSYNPSGRRGDGQLPRSVFKPGESGNPAGLPAGIAEVRALALDRAPRAIMRLEELMEQKDNLAVAAAAATALLDRAGLRPYALEPERVEIAPPGDVVARLTDLFKRRLEALDAPSSTTTSAVPEKQSEAETPGAPALEGRASPQDVPMAAPASNAIVVCMRAPADGSGEYWLGDVKLVPDADRCVYVPAERLALARHLGFCPVTVGGVESARGRATARAALQEAAADEARRAHQATAMRPGLPHGGRLDARPPATVRSRVFDPERR